MVSWVEWIRVIIIPVWIRLILNIIIEYLWVYACMIYISHPNFKSSATRLALEWILFQNGWCQFWMNIIPWNHWLFWSEWNRFHRMDTIRNGLDSAEWTRFHRMDMILESCPFRNGLNSIGMDIFLAGIAIDSVIKWIQFHGMDIDSHRNGHKFCGNHHHSGIINDSESLYIPKHHSFQNQQWFHRKYTSIPKISDRKNGHKLHWIWNFDEILCVYNYYVL